MLPARKGTADLVPQFLLGAGRTNTLLMVHTQVPEQQKERIEDGL